MILDGQIGQPIGGGGAPTPAAVLAPITVNMEADPELVAVLEDLVEITVEVTLL